MLIGLAIDTTGAFVMMALAVWVWRIRPEARLNRTFAALVSALAVAILLLNVGWVFRYEVGETSVGRNLFGILGSFFVAVAAVYVLRLARSFPPLRSGRTRARVLLPWLVALLYLGINVALAIEPSRSVQASDGTLFAVPFLLNGLGIITYTAAALYLLSFLAIRFRAVEESVGDRWQAATIAIALGAFPIYAHGAATADPPGSVLGPGWLAGFALVPIVLVAALWLWAGATRGARLAFVTAWSIIGLALLGVAAGARFGFEVAINSGALGFLRLAGTALLAYAILRHQLFDIDLKVKWTLSRGTLAAIFVAVVFVVSEGAQELFSAQIGLWPGLVAAGLLVFAISPLQRFAERVSDAAMPHVQDTNEYRLVRKREVYLAAVESALLDGQITDRERDVLTTLATELGLTPSQALGLERSARAARSGAGATG